MKWCWKEDIYSGLKSALEIKKKSALELMSVKS